MRNHVLEYLGLVNFWQYLKAIDMITVIILDPRSLDNKLVIGVY